MPERTTFSVVITEGTDTYVDYLGALVGDDTALKGNVLTTRFRSAAHDSRYNLPKLKDELTARGLSLMAIPEDELLPKRNGKLRERSFEALRASTIGPNFC